MSKQAKLLLFKLTVQHQTSLHVYQGTGLSLTSTGKSILDAILSQSCFDENVLKI